MTDLIERLRRYSYQKGAGDNEQSDMIMELVKDMHEAANEIERLEGALRGKRTKIETLEAYIADTEQGDT